MEGPLTSVNKGSDRSGESWCAEEARGKELAC